MKYIDKLRNFFTLNGSVFLCTAADVMKQCTMCGHKVSIMLFACLLSSGLFHGFNIGEPVFKGKEGSFFVLLCTYNHDFFCECIFDTVLSLIIKFVIVLVLFIKTKK